MTDIRTRDLDRRLLLGWQDGTPGNRESHGGTGSYRIGTAGAESAPDYRPGYAMFKILLAGSLLVLLASLIPWQSAQAGSMPDVDAAGHMYVSVPLNAAAPQFQDTTLQVDLMGAGLHVGGMEVTPQDTTPRFRLGKRKYAGRGAVRPLPAAISEPVVDIPAAERKSTLFDDLKAAYSARHQNTR